MWWQSDVEKKSTWNWEFKTQVPHSPHSTNRPLLLLPSRFDSSSSCSIWSSVLLPFHFLFLFFFFFLPNLVLSSGSDLILCSSSLSSRSSSIENWVLKTWVYFSQTWVYKTRDLYSKKTSRTTSETWVFETRALINETWGATLLNYFWHMLTNVIISQMHAGLQITSHILSISLVTLRGR